jgi:cytosine permease
MAKIARLAGNLDELCEFDREPVTPDKLQGGTKFAGRFAGEHVAATELVIALFFGRSGIRPDIKEERRPG